MDTLSGSLVDRIEGAAARLQPYLRETMLVPSEALSLAANSPVWLKCENLQPTASFKVRGALNKILSLSPHMLARGVVAASTGNHGVGVAHALAVVGSHGTIYAPTTATPSKIARLQQYPNVIVESHGADSAATEAYARTIAARKLRAYISPYNDLDVIAGQGTVGIELWRQCPTVDVVFMAVGGGGLISGVASYLKARNPAVRIVGCWPERAPALAMALAFGRILEVRELPTLSDGTAGGIEPGAITFELARDLIDERVLVSEAEIAAAIRLMVSEHRMVVEGAAGVAVAAYRRTAQQRAGQTVAIVLCGGNIDPSTLVTVLRAPRT